MSAPDPKLLEWASPREREVLEALIRAEGDGNKAAIELSITNKDVWSYVSKAKKKAARQGYSPEHDMIRPVPEGFHLRGTSTYYGSEGKPRGQWVKNQIDPKQQLQRLLDALPGLLEPYKGAAEPVPAPSVTMADTLCVYPMGDPHIGMLSWAPETGHDFDLRIAERNLVAAVDHLVSLAPPAEQGLIINLGDFFHADNPQAITARSGHHLDVDSRWSKTLVTGVRLMRRLIDKTLEKHRTVRVINEIGNHDDQSSIVLSVALAQFYERDERVEIDTSPNTFHWYRFGESLIGTTHGHQTKPAELPMIMAQDQKVAWGETRYRYWYCGHVHHDSLKEFPGCIVETFRTLAPRDAWHNSQGYRSGQDMKCDIFDRKRGRIVRHTVDLDHLMVA